MDSINILKNRLIDKIFASQNSQLLERIEKLIDSKSDTSESLVHLNSEQLEMLLMGVEDVKQGRFISQEELDDRDQEWLG